MGSKKHRNHPRLTQQQKDELEIKRLAAQIPNEVELRRILSGERDLQMRFAVFEKIKPYLRFDVSHMYHN